MQSEDVQEQLRARASGTTVLGIKQTGLRKVLLSLPPFGEQRAIAHILGTLDDKIELNRRMNETLEAMARALQIVVRGLRPRPRQGRRPRPRPPQAPR
jgi:type I restriction enzyme S subunit